jgi:Fructose-2,6-bisphosphatase
MKLILIRHGESISNQKKVQLNNNENLLTSKGEEQANLCGKSLSLWIGERNFKFYASTSVRARLTAEIIKNQFDRLIQIDYDSRLIEKRSQESYEEVFNRFKTFIPLTSKDNINDLIVVITHGNLIQSVMGNALSLPDCSIIETTNCGVSIIDNGRLISYNMFLHLHELSDI